MSSAPVPAPLPDAEARAAALDPRRSCIVQAPAGSGKTGLLIRRFLRLLLEVEAPESILAVTFTRKAAAEMRHRLQQALVPGFHDDDPEFNRIAAAARARDLDREWQLTTQPARLHVETIDALAARLAARMPWLSRFGPAPQPVTQADPYYQQAAQKVLTAASPPAKRLLAAYLADGSVLARKLGDLLSRRDQWLPLLRDFPAGDGLRAAIEAELQRRRAAIAAAARAAFERAGRVDEVVDHARLCGLNRRGSGDDCPLSACADLTALPVAGELGWPAWMGLVELFLTSEGLPRKAVNIKQGFGRDELARKRAFLTLAPGESLAAALRAIRLAPHPHLTDAEWELTHALLQLLPEADTVLRAVFAYHGVVDFIAIAAAATDALGSPGAPSDLAFALDGSLRHLLVDEFQDTSRAQLTLLGHLVDDWAPGDNRTLFLVGDPMQSIFGFRNADVRGFLGLWRERQLKNVLLSPLSLECNFRSARPLVEFCNRAFGGVIAAHPDAAGPSLRFAPAVAAGAHALADDAVVYFRDPGDHRPQREARQVADIVLGEESAFQQDRGGRRHPPIAILAATRTHFAAIVPELIRSGIRFEAVDLLFLSDSPVVQDLLALTRALLHPADRTAWLALLRGPWCGLALADLHALCATDPEALMEDLLASRSSLLSDEGRTRVARLSAVLAPALARRRRLPLRSLVEWCWQGLGGDACIRDERHATHAEAFFHLLDEGECAYDDLASRAGKLYLPPTAPAPDGTRPLVQLLTMHDAKGLEFETVILPGLARTPRNDDERLFAWDDSSPGHCLFSAAPIPSPGRDEGSLYTFLKRAQAERVRQERMRLLYVAATRARRRLYLVAHVPPERAPDARSSLNCIWAAVESDMRAAAPFAQAQPPPAAWENPPLRRVPSAWQPPAPPPGVAFTVPPLARRASAAHVWAGVEARAVGQAVHALLHRMARMGELTWDQSRLDALLRAAGVNPAALAAARARAEAALAATVADSRGRWLLARHADAECELALGGVIDGELRQGILDRTFVDHDGVRWVVDYKMSSPGAVERELFLDAECDAYRGQLDLYAALLAARHGGVIRRGLYFPLVNGWREW